VARLPVATGDAAVDGSIVGGPAAIKQSTVVAYDPDLSWFSLTLYADELIAAPLSFLHISVNQVTVDGPTSTGQAALNAPSPVVESVLISDSGSGHDITVDWSITGPQLSEVTVTAVDVVSRDTESETTSVSGSSANG